MWALGCVLYEALTGRRPGHRGASAPSGSNPRVPRELDGIVLRAVAPNPDNRYQSIVTLSAELRSFNSMLEIRGSLDDEPEDEAPRANLGRILVGAVAGVLALAALAWWLLG